MTAAPLHLDYAPPPALPPGLPSLFAPGDDGLRGYQTDALNAWLRGVRAERGGVVVIPTGGGKTRTAGSLIKRWPGRALWLTHLDTLVQQSREDLEEHVGELVELEQGPYFAGNGRVVIASVQSLSKPRRLHRFAPDAFSLIVVDEAHHIAGQTYRRIVDYFAGAKLFAITATPNRADKVALDSIAGPRLFTYGITRGIDDGYLVPVRTVVAELSKLDLSKLRARGGDFADAELAREMDRPEVFRAIVDGVLEHAGDRRTVLFFPSVDTAHTAAAAFNDVRPGSARAVDGGLYTETDEKKRLLEEHQAGAFQFLCNVGVTAEGYNDKGIRCVAVVRPTKSKSAHAQWVGRGTRPLADVDGGRPGRLERLARIVASSKPDLLVIDFTANSGRHDLASVTDYIAGNIEPEVAKAAKAVAKAKPGMLATDVIKAAREEVEVAKRRLADEAKRVAEAEAVTLEWREVDPFKALGTKLPPAKAGEPKASMKMRVYLEKKLGQPMPDDLTAGQAKKMQGTLYMRQKLGLSTLAQVRRLRGAGVQAPERMRMSTASSLIDWLVVHHARSFPPGVVDRIVAATRAGAEG